MKDEALRLALEALVAAYQGNDKTGQVTEAITACKQALANEALDKMAENERELGIQMQPEPEPVAWMNKHGDCMSAVFKQVDATAGEYTTPLYTSQPKRKPLPVDNDGWYWLSKNECIHVDLIRKVEAAHGIKENT